MVMERYFFLVQTPWLPPSLTLAPQLALPLPGSRSPSTPLSFFARSIFLCYQLISPANVLYLKFGCSSHLTSCMLKLWNCLALVPRQLWRPNWTSQRWQNRWNRLWIYSKPWRWPRWGEGAGHAGRVHVAVKQTFKQVAVKQDTLN